MRSVPSSYTGGKNEWLMAKLQLYEQDLTDVLRAQERCGRFLLELPALGVDPRLSKFGEAVFTQTLVNAGLTLVFVLKTDVVSGEKLEGASQRRCCLHWSHTISL